MPISYPLVLPASCYAEVTLRAVDSVAYSQSPFTFAGQAQDWGGQMWQADVTLPQYRREKASEWSAFLVALRGQVGTFLLGDRHSVTPQGEGGGVPVVNGAGQTGGTLAIGGATASQSAWLKAGDYLQLGMNGDARLHKVLQDADSDASGLVSVEIWPALRVSPASGSAVTINSARGVFRLAGNTREWSIGASGLFGIQFSAMEAL